MKIKANSKPYSQLTEVMATAKADNPNDTPESYAANGKSLTYFLWSMFWYGSDKLQKRLVYDSWNVREGDESQIVVLGSNDNTLTTTLKHIWFNALS